MCGRIISWARQTSVTDGLLAEARDSVDSGRWLDSAERTERSLAPREVPLCIVAILATDPLLQSASSAEPALVWSRDS
jgi:hypothetical protein